MIKLRILSWRDVIIRIIIREKVRQESRRQIGHMMTEAEDGVMHFEDGGRGH